MSESPDTTPPAPGDTPAPGVGSDAQRYDALRRLYSAVYLQSIEVPSPPICEESPLALFLSYRGLGNAEPTVPTDQTAVQIAEELKEFCLATGRDLKELNQFFDDLDGFAAGMVAK
jgi:hypothetical protein